MNRGVYRATHQAKVKTGFNNLPGLRHDDVIEAKIQLNSLNMKAERKCLEEISKYNEIKFRNRKSIAGKKKIFQALKFDYL